MKTTLAFLFALALDVAALDITAGKTTYRDCTNLRAVDDELRFMHSTGTARVRYDQLPAEVVKKYFSPQQLAAIHENEKQAAEANAAAERAAQKAYREHNAEMERKAAVAAAAIAAKKEADRLTAEGVARQAAADREWEEKKKAREAAARAAEAAENAQSDHYIAAFAAFRDAAKKEGDLIKQFGIPPAPEVAGLSPEESAARSLRLENYRAKKWERFTAKMVVPTKDGQIMQTPRGMTIHVRGDLGKAKGETYAGYFEREGNYDYTSASGPERVQNYLCRGSASSDMGADSVLLGKIKLRIMKGEKIPFEVAAELQVRLESEGAYVTPMSELIDFLRRR